MIIGETKGVFKSNEKWSWLGFMLSLESDCHWGRTEEKYLRWVHRGGEGVAKITIIENRGMEEKIGSNLLVGLVGLGTGYYP